MKQHPRATTVRRLAMALGCAAVMAGCATTSPGEVEPKALAQTEAVRTGPSQAPFRSITGFTPALRCMDNLFIDYGVRDVSLLVEDIFDQTKKVNAGTRDMLITAVSDMTRRSRALRVIAFGRDTTNAISFLSSAQRQGAYEVVPPFGIKGSVSQFDENVVRNQKDVGLGFQPFLNLGVSRDAATSVLGLDLSVLSTDDLSILSGVTSRNSVVLLKTGRGADADAAYHKFGISYSMSLSRSEGQAQALRGLVELAVVELMGKLTKTPYWTCLGADAQNEEIKLEISDWYFAMAADRGELIAWFQNQLRRRGFYQGPVDGKFNPAVDEAIVNYRTALGMSAQALLDEALFRAFLTGGANRVARPAEPARYVAAAPATPTPAASAPAASAPTTSPPAQPAAPAAVAAAPAPPAAAAPGPATATPGVPPRATAQLRLVTRSGLTTFARGEPIRVVVQPSQDAYVYCYLRDENAKLIRFFPNRFAKDPFVPAGSLLELPGKMPFELAMKRAGAKETIACFATPRDVSTQVPNALFGGDLEPIAAGTLEQVRAAFLAAAGPALVHEALHVQAR